MSPTQLRALETTLRDQLAEAHRSIVAARRTSTDFGLLDAVHDLASVCASLVDLSLDLASRLPMTEGEMAGLVLEEKP